MYRKYDDIVRKQPGWFGNIDFRSNRLLALEALLPRWSGFCNQSVETDQSLTAHVAIAEFIEVVASLTNVPVWENNQPERKMRCFRPRDLTEQDIAEVSATLLATANSLLMYRLYYSCIRQLRSILDLNCNF